MPPTRFRIELGDGDRRVTILNRATSSDYPCLAVDWSSGLVGWYGTPDAKVSLTERQTSDGAHEVPDDQVLYAARTVTVGVVAFGDGRAQILAQQALLSSLAGRMVRVRVVDATSDTYVFGYVTCKWDGERNYLLPYQQGTLAIVCPDPRRLATAGATATIVPNAPGKGTGLSYGPSPLGLSYPLSYGAVGGGGNVATLANGGSATAWPTVSVIGPFASGFRLDLSGPWGASSVEYSAPVQAVPVVLDFRERTATCAGLDRSRHLTARGFRGVAPGSSMTVSLQAEGSGWASCEVRDTYI